MKRYAILVSDYPSEKKPNILGFVHSRVRAYKREGLNVEVYKISTKIDEYLFENILVFCDTKDNLKRHFQQKRYDAILIHFLDQTKIDIVGNQKCYIWVHGFEALSWKRRLFNLNPRIPLYIYENKKQLKAFRQYALSNPQSTFIFVSNWMYNVACKDIKYKIPNYTIIHNYIDETIFQYKLKLPEDRKRVLLVRSFANKKYANDISMDIICELSKKDYFSEVKFTIYGEGRLFKKCISKIKKFNNVEINNHFISQAQIAELQKENGVFLCPTRQDAQGVSMCEAMCSGLVPLTSYNTAIPEFVSADKEGLLCDNDNIESFVEAFEKIFYDKTFYLNMSRAASNRVREQCSFANTIQKEIDLIIAK